METLGIVISTYNRPHLLRRALSSAVAQSLPPSEIIVVDDASETSEAKQVCEGFRNVKYLRQQENKGPGPARNRGIRESSARWILILDDDDELRPDALYHVHQCWKRNHAEVGCYPVWQFATTNASLKTDGLVVRLEDYLKRNVIGDFTPVINRDVFLSQNLSYPSLRIGGESLLWWDIAKEKGIPSWGQTLVRVNSDATLRLTSVDHQLQRASEYASFQAKLLDSFAKEMEEHAPELYMNKVLGHITYLLLAGHRREARLMALRHFDSTRSGKTLLMWSLSFLPLFVTRSLFRAFRESR